jgi:hypothetical protein
MTLQFHQSIFDLLGITPHLSEEKIAIIAASKKICDRQFPKSIEEWFIIEGVESLFHENTEDWLTEIDELDNPSDIRQGYLRIATENQCVVAYYAQIDGSEDPPVFHNNDEWNEDLSTTGWQLCSKTFSNFIFDMISHSHFDGWYSGAYLSAKAKSPDLQVIEYLRKHYQEGLISDYPDSQVYRFFNIHGIITVASNTPELIAENLAEWNIQTDSFDALYDFTLSVWEFCNLSNELSSEGCLPAKGNEVLERLLTNLA